MRVTMELTLEGLVRALRMNAHALAEEVEAGYGSARRVMGRRALSSFDELRMRDSGAMKATDLERDEVGE